MFRFQYVEDSSQWSMISFTFAQCSYGIRLHWIANLLSSIALLLKFFEVNDDSFLNLMISWNSMKTYFQESVKSFRISVADLRLINTAFWKLFVVSNTCRKCFHCTTWGRWAVLYCVLCLQGELLPGTRTIVLKTWRKIGSFWKLLLCAFVFWGVAFSGLALFTML